MKTMRTITAGILLSSALISSCSKDSSLAVNPTSNDPTAKTITDEVHVRFDQAQMIASYFTVTYNGGRTTEFADLRKIDLYGSVIQQFEVQPGDYKTLTAEIHGRPYNTAGALTFYGSVMLEDGESFPLTFRVDDLISLSVTHQPFSFTDDVNFIGLFNIRPELLVHGISPDMWRSAERNGEEILITSRINPKLYTLVLENLKRMVAVRTGTPGPQDADREVPF